MFALRNKEWFCLALSPLMRSISFVIRPVVTALEAVVNGFVNWTTRLLHFQKHEPVTSEPDELTDLFDMAKYARASRLIGGREETIIKGAAFFSRRKVREIMLPASHINMINAGDSMSDCLIKAHLYLHTRYPVTEKENDPQSIRGYVNFKDIIALMRLAEGKPTIRAILRPISSISSEASIASALEVMIQEHTRIAVVRDGSALITGMITLEDIMEELVGKIHDEHDRLPTHVVRSGEGWVVGGGISLEHLKIETGIDLAAATGAKPGMMLTEWVEGHFKRQIRGGDETSENGIRIAVRKIRREHVLEVQLTMSRPSG